MSISERLKLVCQEKNWKLKDFSEATGLPYRTAQGYLNGTREPNAEGMATICSQANINLNWLIIGNGHMFINDAASHCLSEKNLNIISKLEHCSEEEKQIIDNILDIILSKK